MKSKIPLSQEKYSLRDFLRNIDLNSKNFKKIESAISGHFKSTLSGPGFDFNEIREYKPGDDLRHISWSNTAKTGRLHSKEFFSEREFQSVFLIDISNSMFCGNKFNTFIKTVAGVLKIASSFSDKLGSVFFSDDIKYHFPLLNSKSQMNIIFESLVDYYFNLDSKVSNLRQNTNIFNALEFSKQYFSKKSIIFIISDFINLYNFEKILFETASKQNVYLFQMYDELDYKLPNLGYVNIIDPETKEYCTVNTDSKLIQKEYFKLMSSNNDKLSNLFKLSGAKHFLINEGYFRTI